MGGKPSGPAAEFVLSFFRIERIISGVISTSDMPLLSLRILEGTCGVEPLSDVKTDWKYSLSKFALSKSDVSRTFEEFLRGGMLDLLPILLLMNL